MATPATKITRDDLEARLQTFQDGLQGKVEDRKQTLLTAGAAVAALVVLVVFVLGRRAGKKKTTIVEIRRV